MKTNFRQLSASASILLSFSLSPLLADESVMEVLTLEKDTNAVVHVESGDTLNIDKIAGSRGTITKTGGGTLRVKLNRNRNVSFDVQEGKILFDRQMPSICAQAAFHVDASRADTLVLEEENGTNFVVRWNDVRGNGLFATNCLYEKTWRHDPENRRAFISGVTQNGLPVVDFGTMLFPAYTNAAGQAKGYGATMIWSKPCTAAREVYEVISDTPDVATVAVENPQFYDKIHAVSFISSSTSRAGNYREKLKKNGGYPNIFYDNSNNYGWMGGSVYQNAVLKAPNSNGASGKFDIGSGFSVLGFTTRESDDYSVRVDSFARDHNNSFGGQRLGEYLVFSNRLTSVQRDALQKYLNEKWRGTVPAYMIASLTVAPDAEVAFAPGVSVTVANIADGSDFTVENGAVELNALKNPNAYFHVDADAAATLHIEAQNGTNFVNRWDDASGGSVYATASTKTYGNWLPDPENRRPFISGEKLNNRPVVDFGPLQVASHTNELGYGMGYGAAMEWSAKMPTSARELFTIARDTEDVKTLLGHSNTLANEHGQSLICDKDYDGGACYRGELKSNAYAPITFHNSHNAAIYEGRTYIDGVFLSSWKTTSLPGGFHVFNLQLAYKSDKFPKPKWFANSGRKTNKHFLGGTKIAEYLVFDHPLTNAVRSDIYSALRTKWFGDERAVQTFGKLTVGAGATLALAWKDVAVTNRLAIGGVLNADSASAASLRLTADGAAVSGALTIEDGATVTVDVAGGTVGSLAASSLTLAGGGRVVFASDGLIRLPEGEIPLLTGNAFTHAGSEWTIDSSVLRGVTARISVKDDGLYAVISRKSIRIIVR